MFPDFIEFVDNKTNKHSINRALVFQCIQTSGWEHRTDVHSTLGHNTIMIKYDDNPNDAVSITFTNEEEATRVFNLITHGK